MKVLLFAAILLTGSATARAQSTSTGACDPEGYSTRPAKEKAAIEKAFRAEPKLDEMQVFVRSSMETVKSRVLLAMVACKMPVTVSNEGVLVADYGSHMGLVANFKVVARAYLLPVGDSVVMVRLAATEQSDGSLMTAQKAVTNRNSGGSTKTWIDMRNVAKQLLADRELRADWERSTQLGLVYLARPNAAQPPE